MASVHKRSRADGTSGYVAHVGQGGKQRSRTFDDQGSADRLVRMIDDFGAERALRYLQDEAHVEEELSLDELAQRWLASKEGDVTPNILRGYRRDYDSWIKPRFGHREAAYIHESDVQAWVDWTKVHPSPTTGKPLSAKSIADRHAIRHQIYGWGSARTRNLVPHNACKETESHQDAADLVAYMAGTGWRIGESVALLAGAVEDYGDKLYVNMERVLRRRGSDSPRAASRMPPCAASRCSAPPYRCCVAASSASAPTT